MQPTLCKHCGIDLIKLNDDCPAVHLPDALETLHTASNPEFMDIVWSGMAGGDVQAAAGRLVVIAAEQVAELFQLRNNDTKQQSVASND